MEYLKSTDIGAGSILDNSLKAVEAGIALSGKPMNIFPETSHYYYTAINHIAKLYMIICDSGN